MSTLTRPDRIAQLYRATTTPRLVVVPAMSFLAVDGHGDPNSSTAYAAAVQALFAVSYGAKFAIRKAGGEDFKVAPLEGLWWAEDRDAFDVGDKSDWDWTMMIRQPDVVTDDLVARLAEDVVSRKALPAARSVRLQTFEEGPAAQLLHVGPYATEGPTIARLHAFLHDQGLDFDGHVHKHHEIYLGDPRRSAPERLRTILRQPYAVA
jgi:hypothetical protein